MSSFIGAIAIGDLVKSTLGPKGMDKILVSTGRNHGQVYIQEIIVVIVIFKVFYLHLKLGDENIIDNKNI